MNPRILTATLVAALALGLSGVEASAQPAAETNDEDLVELEAESDPSSDREMKQITPEERREKARKRIETLRTVRLSEELDLDEEKALKLSSRLRAVDEKRWKLLKDRKTLQRDLQEAARSESLDEAGLNKLIAEQRRLRGAIVGLEDEELKALDGILDPKQKAKYLVFKERFRDEMREKISAAKKRRAPANR